MLKPEELTEKTYILKKHFTHGNPAKGSKYLTKKVIEIGSLSAAAKITYAALMTHKNNDPKDPVDILRLARQIHQCKPKEVMTHLEELQEHGLVLVTTSTIYLGNPDNPAIGVQAIWQARRKQELESRRPLHEYNKN